MKLTALFPLVLSLAETVLTRKIPQNLQSFLDEYKVRVYNSRMPPPIDPTG